MMLTIGLILIFLVVGGGAFMLISGSTSATFGIGKTLGLSGVTGFFGAGLSIYTDTWNLIVSSAYGVLGMYGYLFLLGLGVMVAVWIWNGFRDVSQNKPIGIVD